MFQTCRSAGIAVGVLVFAVALLIVPACSQQQQQQPTRPQVAARGGTPVLHAVYAKELRAAMRELDTMAGDQLWMQIYTGLPHVDMSQVAATADKMADVAANRLPSLVGSDQLPPDELQIYNNLARRLHDQAVILKQQADRNELAAAQATTNQIINTCNTCHTMFRGVAGPLKQ